METASAVSKCGVRRPAARTSAGSLWTRISPVDSTSVPKPEALRIARRAAETEERKLCGYPVILSYKKAEVDSAAAAVEHCLWIGNGVSALRA